MVRLVLGEYWRKLKFFDSQCPEICIYPNTLLLPTEGLSQALQVAARSGVDVRIMIPERSDTRMAHLATRSFLAEMIRAGVKIYFYQPGFLHAKLIVSDDAVACIGSANMDFRSLEHNFEINAFVYQREFAMEMRRIFMYDVEQCLHITPSIWLKRPLSKRFLNLSCGFSLLCCNDIFPSV